MKTRKGLQWIETILLFLSLCGLSSATLTVVVLDQNNPGISNFTFLAQEARFGPTMSMMGISGPIYEVESQGCVPFEKSKALQNVSTWIAVIKRGDCTFETKVLNAGYAGASFVLIYNNVTAFGNSLIAMNGGAQADQVNIPSAFIAKENGEKLIQVITERGNMNSIILVLPSNKPTSSLGGVNGHWAVIVFVGILAILISSFFILIFLIVEIYRQRRRRRRRRSKRVPQEVIIKIPIQKVTEEDLKNENKNLTCAICLDDYQLDDSTRKLPCDHEFHQACIDPWFQRNRLCPVCKRDVQNGVEVIYKPSRSSRDSASIESVRPSEIEMQPVQRDPVNQLGRIAEENENEQHYNVVRSLSEAGLIEPTEISVPAAATVSPSESPLRGFSQLIARFRKRDRVTTHTNVQPMVVVDVESQPASTSEGRPSSISEPITDEPLHGPVHRLRGNQDPEEIPLNHTYDSPSGSPQNESPISLAVGNTNSKH